MWVNHSQNDSDSPRPRSRAWRSCLRAALTCSALMLASGCQSGGYVGEPRETVPFDSNQDSVDIPHSFTSPNEDNIVAAIDQGAVDDAINLHEEHGAFKRFTQEDDCPVRGDVNGDGAVDIADPIGLLAYLFEGADMNAEPEALDANADGTIDVADSSYLFSYLFGGGSAPTSISCGCGGHGPASLRTYLIQDILAVASGVATTMETTRRLPPEIQVDGSTLSNEQFLNLAAATLGELAADAGRQNITLYQKAQPDLLRYSHAPLDPNYYDQPFSKDGYIEFFGQICDRHGEGPGPSTLIEVNGATVRGVEALYYASHLLRQFALLEQLPGHLKKTIISPQGLFPWETPSDVLEYTSVLNNRSPVPQNPDPFGTHHWTGFYHRYPAHHFDVFSLAREVVGDAETMYEAGRRIYDWARSLNNRWFYNQGGITQLGVYGASQYGEVLHKQWATSGLPRHIMAVLMRAVGIAASPSGAIYLNGEWANMDQHRAYGSRLEDNPYYYDSVEQPETYNLEEPTPENAPVQMVREMATEASLSDTAPDHKSLFVNARDLERYGTADIVNQALLGGFTTIILTVKTEEGTTFFEHRHQRPSTRHHDPLSDLIDAAHLEGLEVWAGFSTLVDRQQALAEPNWRQIYAGSVNGAYQQKLHLSACSTEVRNYLTDLVQDLAANYPIDGLVLTGHYFGGYWNGYGWQGPAHPDCPTSEPAWAQNQLTELAAELFGHLTSLRPEATRVVTSFVLGTENASPNFSSSSLGQQNISALEEVSDHVMLVLNGHYWVTGNAADTTPDQILQSYTALFNAPPILSMYLSHEWLYADSFYHDVATVMASRGWNHINFHTTLSLTNQFQSSLTPSHLLMLADD